jgi:hypothetical protein
MEKPIKKKREYYDYNECRDYLQKKYDYDERDYAKKYKTQPFDAEIPYFDFWHWVIANHEIHNGCEIMFYREKMEEIKEDWVKEIYSRYIEEFAEESGELEMYVSW